MILLKRGWRTTKSSAIHSAMETFLDASGGELRLAHPIPRIRHVRLPDETPLDLARRIAQSVAFAFHLDAEHAAAQPGFDSLTETIVLPDGVITRSTIMGAVTLTRDAARIAATNADQLFIFLIESGTLDVQPTRTGRRLGAGDILIVDLTQAVTLFEADHTAMMLVIARGLLPEAARDLDLHCCEVPANHALARVIVSTVRHLWEDSRLMTPAQGSAVLHSAIDMLGLALTDVKRAQDTAATVKAHAEALIDDHIADATLSPSWVADRLGISRATLYRAFAPYGGVARFIEDRRLQNAWVLVSSPAGPPLGEIAKSCGYSSRTRLIRAFKECFGVTPDDIRAANDEDRLKYHADASLAIMEVWERRSGKTSLNGDAAAVVGPAAG